MLFTISMTRTYYSRRVYTGCVRALDFLCSLPEYDGENLGVIGGSQGGALAIVTAGLDTRVKALVAFYPALCDLTGYLHGRAGGWPAMFAPQNQNLNNKPEKVATSRYYDVVNFAVSSKLPVITHGGIMTLLALPRQPIRPTCHHCSQTVIHSPRHGTLAYQRAGYHNQQLVL